MHRMDTEALKGGEKTTNQRVQTHAPVGPPHTSIDTMLQNGPLGP
jgi:hypothetical protein